MSAKMKKYVDVIKRIHEDVNDFRFSFAGVIYSEDYCVGVCYTRTVTFSFWGCSKS